MASLSCAMRSAESVDRSFCFGSGPTRAPYASFGRHVPRAHLFARLVFIEPELLVVGREGLGSFDERGELLSQVSRALQYFLGLVHQLVQVLRRDPWRLASFSQLASPSWWFPLQPKRLCRRFRSRWTYEANERELGLRAEAHRWSPATGSGADIDPHPAAARQAGGVRRVDEAHGERPRKELAGVGVARQLEVEAGGFAERRELRVVGEQHTE